MAVSTSFCVGFLCFIFFGLLSAQANNQLPGNSDTGGQGSSFFFYQYPEYPRDCSEVRDSCSLTVASGVYVIKPDGYEEPFEAYCHNDVDSGGWTVILRRFDGSLGFNRNWNDYKAGFGFLSAEFWIGHGKLSFLTNQAVYELLIDVTLENGTVCDIKYDKFRIGDEWSDYKMSILGTYESDIPCRWKELDTNFSDCNDVYNAGHTQDGVYFIRPAGWNKRPFEVFCNMSIDDGSWTVYSLHNIQNTPFSTFDQDNDGHSHNCAEGHRSGWWHGAYFYNDSSSYCWNFQSGSRHILCSHANHNGVYNGGKGQNMFTNTCFHRYTELKLRRIS